MYKWEEGKILTRECFNKCGRNDEKIYNHYSG